MNGFGVKEESSRIYVDVSPKSFAQKKHALVQAMLAVNDMFLTSKKQVLSLFFEDVVHFLKEHKIRFSKKIGQDKSVLN